jgi:SAM-dependent methyltransferase
MKQAPPSASQPAAPTVPSATAFADAAETWNRRFGKEDYLFGTEPNGWLKAQAHHWPAGARVLCVADGEGRNSVWLARQGLVVQAFDIAEVGVAKARRLAADAGVTVDYTVADGDAYAWPEAAFDGVAAIFIQFADPALRQRLFRRMVASLKPGGTLVLQGYTPKQLDYRTGGPPQVSHLYTPALLREAFADLEIVELREYEADVDEGAGHHGRSALIGLVARRR